MAKTNEDGSVMHLRKDPNDPRNVPNSDVLPLLTEVKELEPTSVPVSEVEDVNGVQHIGVDPNDPRATREPELVSFKTGEKAD